ncbi:T9SS type A sorting domain-containing protein [Hyphobacterium sp. CCMP332]|nr:T9SS type A sorting domain-containing protein [Hyphobacterium sp. CCMP332]
MRILFAFFLSILITGFCLAQNLNVTGYQLNGLSNASKAYLLANENIVVESSGNVFLYTDSLNNTQLNLPGNLINKGRGSSLILRNTDTLFVWENGLIQTYLDPNATFAISPEKITQLPDQKLLMVNRSAGVTIDLIIADTNNFQLVPTSNNTGLTMNNSFGILEFDQNKYFCSFLLPDIHILYDLNTNTVTEYNDSVFVGNNLFLGYNKGPNGSIRIFFDDGITTFRNDSILNISYYQSAGITINFTLAGNRFATTQDGQYTARLEQNQLIIFDGNNFVRYDTSQGVPVNGNYRMAEFNSNNELIAVDWVGRVFKFSIPQVTGIKAAQDNYQVSIFPNPANRYIHVNSPSVFFEKAELVDLIGRKSTLDIRNLNSKQMSFEIPEILNSGMYILNLTGTKGERISRKMIIKE